MKRLPKKPSSATYEVGYGKPPARTRFKPRASGNPGGRPRGMTAERAKKLALKEAYRPITIREGDKIITLPAFQAIMRQLISYMMEDPRTITAALEIVFIAKSIERIGDHAKNIAEAAVQAVMGIDVRHASADQIRAELSEP